MALVRKRKLATKTSWQVIIRKKGFKTLVKSFSSRSDAYKWSRHMERNLDVGITSDFLEASKYQIKDIINRYLKENRHRHKKGWRVEEYRARLMLLDPVADVNFLHFSTKDIAEYRDRRLEVVSKTTFNKDLSFLNVLCDLAMNDWGINIPFNPCKNIKRLREPRPRKRRLVLDEYERLQKACKQSENKYLYPMFEFSIETAIRQGELLKLKYNDIDWSNHTMSLNDTKNLDDRVVALSDKAYSILQEQMLRTDGKFFDMTKDSLKFWWKQAKRRAKIKDLRWHDLRREACSRLFERGLSLVEVQSISGHRDPRVLLNTYTKLDPKKIVKKLA